MGGTSAMIYGRLDEGFILEPEKVGLLSKIFKGNSHKTPVITDLGNTKLIDHSSKGCRDVCTKLFGDFLDQAFKDPNENDNLTLSYIREQKFNTLSFNLRTEEKEGETQSYLQVAFSGCAGMAEVTSAVAAHWFKIGYERSFGEELSAFLKSNFGFHTERVECADDEFKIGRYEDLSMYIIDDPEYGIMTDAYLEEEMDDFDLAQIIVGDRLGCHCSLCV